MNGASLQKAIARGLASDTGFEEGSRKDLRLAGLLKEVGERGKRSSEALDEIRVIGWRQSKAAGNSDGGVKDLVGFLERKASGTDTSARAAVRIRKVCHITMLGLRGHCNLVRSGPLSSQANSPERRPRSATRTVDAWG